MYADGTLLFGDCGIYQAGNMAGSNGATRKEIKVRTKHPSAERAICDHCRAYRPTGLSTEHTPVSHRLGRPVYTIHAPVLHRLIQPVLHSLSTGFSTGFPVIARSEATKQSIPSSRCGMDCFASLAMTMWRHDRH